MRHLLVLVLALCASHVSAATLYFDRPYNEEYKPRIPSCVNQNIGYGYIDSQSGYFFQDNSYSGNVAGIEISPDGGPTFSTISRYTCDVFSVSRITLSFYNYNLLADTSGSNVMISGGANGRQRVSSILTVPEDSETRTSFDLGDLYRDIDYFTIRLIRPRANRGCLDRDTECFNGIYVRSVDISPVPVPASGILLLFGVGGLVASRRLKSSQKLSRR